MDRAEKIILASFIGLIVAGSCITVVCGISLAFSGALSSITSNWERFVTTPESVSPTEVIPIPETTESSQRFSDAPETTLEALKGTYIPEANLIQLAEEFYGIAAPQIALKTSPPIYKNGDELNFLVLDEDTNTNKKITATLQYQTGSVYFWVQNGVHFDGDQAKRDVDTFANKIYPTDQEFFGKEWIPGVDNDPHLFILYTKGMGANVAGYVSSSDAYLKQVQPYSNEKEMFYLNADVQGLSDPYTMSVMAHELQHLIHGYHDANEESWLNEGFSELAVFLNGYSAGSFDRLFAADPDIDLTEWPNDSDATDAHYGASFLFTAYLLDRFGEKATQAVVADPVDGLDSFDDVFTRENTVDPLTHQIITSDDFFQDWTIANYLNDTTVSDGRYGYRNYQSVPNFKDSQTLLTCNSRQNQKSVSQYGTDYLQVSCSSPYAFTFTGASTVNILSEFPEGGSHYLWSNMTDNSDTSMSREFDFTVLSGPINLTYDTWYDIEKDYDYAYLLASTDDSSWQIIKTPSCTTENPTASNYGCGYNGSTGGWIHETVDLSQFAGEKVKLKFEYITDAGVTGEGFVIDQLAIPQLGYQTNFEADNGGWQLDGFTRIENQIPQTFLVSEILKSGNQTVIKKFQTASGVPLTIKINPETDGSEVVFVISGSSRYTRQKASYRVEIISIP